MPSSTEATGTELDDAAADPTGSTPEGSNSTAEGSESTAADAATGDGGAGPWSTCATIEITSNAMVAEDRLVETSGLVASVQHAGLLWAHNDSGAEAGIHALELDGSDRGFFAIEGVAVRDTEDVALANGRIHLGDIGDNNRARDTITIHVFDEPTPEDPGTVTPIDGVTTINARYPDGATDAEALLVDPVTDEIIIFSKDLDDGEALTRIYTVPRETGTAEPVTMTLVGSIDVFALTSQSPTISITSVLFPGQVTAADISPDGSVVAVRTYGSLWLFPRLTGQSVADALTAEPCEAGSATERQGEAVAFLGPVSGGEEPGTVSLATISEGQSPPINVVSVQLG